MYQAIPQIPKELRDIILAIDRLTAAVLALAADRQLDALEVPPGTDDLTRQMAYELLHQDDATNTPYVASWADPEPDSQ